MKCFCCNNDKAPSYYSPKELTKYNIYFCARCLKLLMFQDFRKMKIDNKVYDILKWVALVVLPAIATLYFALAGIWHLPYGEQIVGTITAIDTFIGAILGISNYNYKKKEGK